MSSWVCRSPYAWPGSTTLTVMLVSVGVRPSAAAATGVGTARTPRRGVPCRENNVPDTWMSYGNVYEPNTDPCDIHGVELSQNSSATTLWPDPAPALTISGRAVWSAQVSFVSLPTA